MSKKISLFTIILGFLLIAFGVFTIMVNKNTSKNNVSNESSGETEGKEEMFKIFDGELPMCSKNYFANDDYDSYRDGNIIFTNENYETNKDGNRINNSKLIKQQHEINGLLVQNMEISSKKCFEYLATFSFTMVNKSGNDIENKSLIFHFFNNDENETVVSEVIDIKKDETKKLEIELGLRIIDAKDYTLSLSDFDSSQAKG